MDNQRRLEPVDYDWLAAFTEGFALLDPPRYQAQTSTLCFT